MKGIEDINLEHWAPWMHEFLHSIYNIPQMGPTTLHTETSMAYILNPAWELNMPNMSIINPLGSEHGQNEPKVPQRFEKENFVREQNPIYWGPHQ
jgi:hypothetical protein